MRRTRTEPSAWAAPLLACSLLCMAALATRSAQAQEVADSPERALAREHFAKGVALAKAHAYAEALSEFQQAYAAVPHFSVLYNIGQARLALGESIEGVAALQRYLDDGGPQIDAKRRAEVEALLQRERARLPPEVVSSEAPPIEPATVPATATDPATIPATAAAPEPARPRTRPRAPAPARPPAPAPSRTLAYAVTATGAALSGIALAHYLWNRSRYQDWQNQYATYHRDPTEPNRNAANSLSKSIDNASVVTVVLAIGAGAALGTGGLLWLTSAPSSDPRHGRFDPLIGAQGTF